MEKAKKERNRVEKAKKDKDNMNIDTEYVAALLEKEYEIITTHQRHDKTICSQISNAQQEDGLHDMVDRLLYNRRLANTSLQRAEAILSVIYPDMASKEPGWLTTETLEMWMKKVSPSDGEEK